MLGDVLPHVVAAVSGARLVIYNAAFDLGFLPGVVGSAAATRIGNVDGCV